MNPLDQQSTELVLNQTSIQQTNFFIKIIKKLISRIFKGIVLIIILILAITSLNIIVGHYSKIKKFPKILWQRNPVKTFPSISILSPSVPFKISWKKYNSSDLGISFSYPDTWIVEEKKFEEDQEYATLILRSADNPNDSSLCIGYDYCYSTSGDVFANEPSSTSQDIKFSVLGQRYFTILKSINNVDQKYQRYIFSFRLTNLNEIDYQPYIQSKTGSEKDLETVKIILSKIIYN